MNLEQDKTDLVIGLASTATSRGSSSSSPKKNQPVKTDSTENTSNPPLTSSTVMASAASVNDSQDNGIFLLLFKLAPNLVYLIS